MLNWYYDYIMIQADIKLIPRVSTYWPAETQSPGYGVNSGQGPVSTKD